jgi:hypothetical protein
MILMGLGDVVEQRMLGHAAAATTPVVGASEESKMV